MQTLVFRLRSGQDLKRELIDLLTAQNVSGACILTGVGSLSQTALRYAGQSERVLIAGDQIILTLTGALSREGARIYVSIADSQGIVRGGELQEGSLLGSDMEIVLGVLPETVPAVKPGIKAVAVAATPPITPGKTSTLSGSHFLHTDGASKGNPGPSGIGIALFKTEDPEHPIVAVGEPIEPTTNNVAEYKALIRGLQEALLRGVERLEVRTDSQLMAQQVSGKYKVNAPQILPLHSEARKLLSQFESARVIYVPREQNSLADKLANQGVAAGKR